MQRLQRLAAAGAVALFTLVLGAHAGLEMGLHAPYVKRRGVKADAVLERFVIPKGRNSGFRDKEAVLRLVLPGGVERPATVPVSDSFFERYRGEQGARLEARLLPGSRLLRPVLDEDPRPWGWLWVVVILGCGLLVAASVAGAPPPGPRPPG